MFTLDTFAALLSTPLKENVTLEVHDIKSARVKVCTSMPNASGVKPPESSTDSACLSLLSLLTKVKLCECEEYKVPTSHSHSPQ
jgi:hypothetical protein